jgi:hypothetical protein
MAHTSRGCPIQSRGKTWGGETSGVIVKLGRKLRAVTGQIVDADSSQPVVTARIRISKPGNHRIMTMAAVSTIETPVGAVPCHL